MNDQAWLAEQFEGNRARLRAVAYRLLGSLSEADDALADVAFEQEEPRAPRRTAGGSALLRGLAGSAWSRRSRCS
jgi:hypothetical protein